MRNKKMALILAAGTIIVLGAALWGPITSNVEHPQYSVLSTTGDIEIREYPEMIIAEVTQKGERQDAIGDGFRLLADYIFGNNTENGQIAMTAPVTQQESKDGLWSVRFMMPASYTLETLPKPNNTEVKIREIPKAKFAVIRFSGRSTQDNIDRFETELMMFIKTENIKTKSQSTRPTYAFFNPPWTLPFMRRNEIMVEIR